MRVPLADLSPIDVSAPIDLSGGVLAAAAAAANAFISSIIGRRAQETSSGDATSGEAEVDNMYMNLLAGNLDPVFFSQTIDLGFIHRDLHVAISFELEGRTETTDAFAVSVRIEPRGNSTWLYGMGNITLSLPHGSASSFDLATILRQAQSAEALAGADTGLDWQLATNVSVDYRFVADQPLEVKVDLDLRPSGWAEPKDFLAGFQLFFSDRNNFESSMLSSVPCLYDGSEVCERRSLVDASGYAAYNGSRLDSSLQYEDRDGYDTDEGYLVHIKLTPSNIDGRSLFTPLDEPAFALPTLLVSRLSPVLLPTKSAQTLQSQSVLMLKWGALPSRMD